MSKVILRLPAVQARTGFSRSTIERLEKQGKFPVRVRLSENSVGWHAAEIDEFLANLPRVNSENSIKAVPPALASREKKSHE